MEKSLKYPTKEQIFYWLPISNTADWKSYKNVYRLLEENIVAQEFYIQHSYATADMKRLRICTAQKTFLNKQLKDIEMYLEALKLIILNMVALDFYNPKT